MRVRSLFPLLLLVAGCGGSKSVESDRAVLQLENGGIGQLGAGVDASGEPVLINYKGNGELTVVTASGTQRSVVPSVVVDRFPYVLGDFLLIPGYQDGTDGTLIVNLRDGTSRSESSVFPATFDGERVIWESTALDASTPGFMLEDLATDERSPVSLPDLDRVNAMSGNRIIAGKLIGTTAEGTSALYQYRVVSLDGGASIALKAPTGAPSAIPYFLNSRGEALGNDSQGHLVTWDSGGNPTLITAVQGLSLGLREDGRALVRDNDTNVIDTVDGGQVTRRGPRLDARYGFFSVGEGSFVFVDGPDRIAAYRVR